MKKRTYGTGTLRQLPSGKWLFEYKPEWSPKRLSKTAEAAKAKAAQKILTDCVTELDKRNGPTVTVSINDLIALHVDDMTLNNCESKNILDTERKAKKHLGSYFAKHDFAIALKKANVKAYKKHRVTQGAKPSTVNRELSWLHCCLTLGNNEELTSVPIPEMEKFDESRTSALASTMKRSITPSCGAFRLTRNRSGQSLIATGSARVRFSNS